MLMRLTYNMKYILIFLISFMFAGQVLAANAVKGSVPDLQPLQPAPAGVSAGFSKNIQHQDPNYVPPQGSQSAKSAGGHNSALLIGGTLPGLGSSAGGHNYLLWFLVLIILVLLGYFIYKKIKA
jgi:hypothetical protein